MAKTEGGRFVPVDEKGEVVIDGLITLDFIDKVSVILREQVNVTPQGAPASKEWHKVKKAKIENPLYCKMVE